MDAAHERGDNRLIERFCRGELMPDIRQALQHARRLARHHRGFVAIVVITLGVGIGATTAAMSVAASVLRNALPVRD